jgi:hypothetical protein
MSEEITSGVGVTPSPVVKPLRCKYPNRTSICAEEAGVLNSLRLSCRDDLARYGDSDRLNSPRVCELWWRKHCYVEIG